jgi:Tfp pilus assembly protein PilF
LVASTLDDYNQAADFAKQGLRHNRKSAPLNNTLAFSLASKGELDAAEAVLRKFAPANDDHMSRLISEANHGLIAMRRGDLATGESIYRRVIFRFRQENKVERVATAYAYFAREAANAKHPQAVEILAEAKSWLAAHNYPLARRVIASTEKILTPDVMSSNRGIRRS